MNFKDGCIVDKDVMFFFKFIRTIIVAPQGRLAPSAPDMLQAFDSVFGTNYIDLNISTSHKLL